MNHLAIHCAAFGLLTVMALGARDTSARPAPAPSTGTQPSGAQPAAVEPAGSQPAGADVSKGDPVAYATAKELYADARKARREGDYHRCRVKAAAAWQIYRERAPLVALLGECELELGEPVAAAEHLGLALAAGQLQAKLRQRVQDLLAKAKRSVAVVDVRLEPPAATLAVDGQPRSSPLLYLSPGSHSIEAHHPGLTAVQRTLKLEAGTERQLELTLKPPSGGEGGSHGSRPAPQGGGEGLPLWPAFITGGLAAVGLGVGIAGVVVAGSAKSDAESQLVELQASAGVDNPCVKTGGGQYARGGAAAGCDELLDSTERHDAFNTVAAVGFIGAAVMAAATVAVVLLADDGGGTERASLQLVPLPTGGALLRGRF